VHRRLRSWNIFWGRTGLLRELCRGLLLGVDGGDILVDLSGMQRRDLFDHGRGDRDHNLPRLCGRMVLGDRRSSGFNSLLGLPLGLIRTGERCHKLHELPRGSVRRVHWELLCELRRWSVCGQCGLGDLRVMPERHVLCISGRKLRGVFCRHLHGGDKRLDHVRGLCGGDVLRL